MTATENRAQEPPPSLGTPRALMRVMDYLDYEQRSGATVVRIERLRNIIAGLPPREGESRTV